jgi:non-lysosomal glucosylceramidase
MASFSLLLALSGFEFDTIRKHIGFNPKINKEQFNSFWSLNRAWGNFTHENGNIRLDVKYGFLELSSFQSDLFDEKELIEVYLDNKQISVERSGSSILFAEMVQLEAGSGLRMVLN